MWTAATRAQHRRDGLRFASDLTDAEWAVVAPLLPQPSGIGRPPEWPTREMVNAIFYVLLRHRLAELLAVAERGLDGVVDGSDLYVECAQHRLQQCLDTHALGAPRRLLHAVSEGRVGS